MEIRVLKYFAEVAAQKSMTKAAGRLHVTQPTLSKQIKDLEEELGQKLFTRSNYNINLTPQGEVLYKRAIDIINIVDKTESEFKSMQDFNGGDLHIGCAESYGITIIARTLKALTKKYAGIRFHIYSGNFQAVTEKLDNGILDFAITVQDVDTSLYNSITLPYMDKWGLLMRKDCPLANKKEINIEELSKFPLIVSRQGFSDEMPNELKNIERKMNIIGTYDLLYNASLFVKEGLGFALCFDNLAATGVESELLFREITPLISSPMKIIWSGRQMLSQTGELFLDRLQKDIEKII